MPGEAAAATPPTRARVVRTLGELTSLRAAWAALPASPACDAEAYRVLAEATPGFEPWVLVLEREGALRALVAGRAESHRLRARIAGCSLFASRLRAIVLPPGAIAGTIDDGEAAVIVATLRGVLASGQAEVVVVQEIAVDSALFLELRRRRWDPCRDLSPDHNRRWTTTLPATYAEFLRARSARLRKTIRHAENRLHRVLGERIEVRRYRDAADVDRFLSEAESVAARAYQRRLGAGFRDTMETRAFAADAAARGWLRAWVLALDGVPCAFTWGVCHGGTYHSRDTGFDPRLRLGVGDFLMNREIEDLCRDPQVHRFDFGFGDADYKRRYAETFREEATVRLFAPRPRALLCNTLRGAVARTDRGLREAARALEILGPLRRRVLDLLVRTAAASSPTRP